MKTVFPESAGARKGGFVLQADVFRALEPTRKGESPSPVNSIAMVRIDEHNRFVVNRVGRSEDNRMLLSSSVAGSTKLRVEYVWDNDAPEAGSPTCGD